jgi:hypothetical protein
VERPCTTLHCTALYTALHCTLHCTALHYTPEDLLVVPLGDLGAVAGLRPDAGPRHGLLAGGEEVGGHARGLYDALETGRPLAWPALSSRNFSPRPEPGAAMDGTWRDRSNLV